MDDEEESERDGKAEQLRSRASPPRAAARATPIREGEREAADERQNGEAEASPRAGHGLSGQQDDEHRKAGRQGQDCSGIASIVPQVIEPEVSARLHRPGGREQDQRVKQRGKVVTVGKEAHRFARIGDLKKAQGTVLTLRNLAQADKNRHHANGQHNQTELAPLAIAEQHGRKKNGDRGQQRKGAQPRRPGRHGDGHPR